ncbi:protein-binding 2 [Octopus vulgaris]|uniref:Protein-binding 2 n=1 Tax=Octopus vulgaris TaxID=6645 RepID=A0AA36BWA9_OCTVU|nr:protein-binding 2 [Octopus vulgaris]
MNFRLPSPNKMASACVLQWAPDSLYNTAISATVANYSVFRKDIQNLTESVQFDIFYKLYMKGNLYTLGTDLAEIDNFAKILKVLDKRCLLHHCFQALIDHGAQVNEILATEFCKRYQLSGHLNENERNKAIQLGTALASFFNESGWFFSSERVYHTCRLLCDQDKTYSGLCKLLECNVRLLHVQNSSCKYREANETFKETFKILNILNQANISVNKAMLYGECCGLFFAESQYDQACVVKREFRKAGQLIKSAVQYASEHFGQRHPKYADTLQDYGFYLLNVDSVAASVKVYQMALDIRLSVFGGNNFHVAVAHEDLAYASYVHEYSSGNFKDAQRHAEKAIEILLKILPSDHLLLSSSKRVKALILEEIAIDNEDKSVREPLLSEAKELHVQSLNLAINAFGESNVQTAKHYGNLGRLYQSMREFKLAETHHLKAIEIKERLLGPDDYEVALSVGHLASLYNYDMKYHMEAESLYKRSIEIGKKLFGAGYSGLEYDYKGLLRLYQSQGDRENMLHYSRILQDWNRIRDHTNAIEVKPLDFSLDLSVQDLHKYVFNS